MGGDSKRKQGVMGDHSRWRRIPFDRPNYNYQARQEGGQDGWEQFCRLWMMIESTYTRGTFTFMLTSIEAPGAIVI